jgi:hypothetical protein
MISIRAVRLGEHHLHPGRTKHSIADQDCKHEFPPFIELKIAQYLNDSGCYLMHICENGQVADTWHQDIEDAYFQAEWELGVRRDEWIEINEPWPPVKN